MLRHSKMYNYFVIMYNIGNFEGLLIHSRKVMEFNATFNNISVISWRSVLLVEEIGVPGENHSH
jgi:hypothetical protein